MATNGHRSQTAIAGIATGAASAIAGVRRASSTRSSPAWNTIAAGCLTCLATDISATDRVSAGDIATNRDTTGGNTAEGLSAIGIATERRTAGGIATGIRVARCFGKRGAGAEYPDGCRTPRIVSRAHTRIGTCTARSSRAGTLRDGCITSVREINRSAGARRAGNNNRSRCR